MAGSDEFLRDWRAPHSIAFAIGAAIAIGAIWQVRPAPLMATLDGVVGLLLVGASFVLVLLSNRVKETVRREPLYFVSGVAMGAVLGVKLFV